MDPHHSLCPKNFIRRKYAEFRGIDPGPCACPDWWTDPRAAGLPDAGGRVEP